jgi:transcriptional regulator with XRE-family HTH domain
MAGDARLVGDRIAYHRRRLGLSQVEFAGLVGRSESWVSQVERGVRPVDRMSVLRKVADVLNVPVSELRGQEDGQPEAAERPEAFDLIRSALTGHPALAFLLSDHHQASADLAPLTSQHAQIWDLVHASRYTDLAPILAALIPGLETAIRAASDDLTRQWARVMLADTYQATAAMMAKLGEGDTAWIAADRAAAVAEASGDALAVAASMYQMAHVFLSLDQVGQAQQVAAATAAALEPGTKTRDSTPEAQSLYGACQLVLATTAARDNDRTTAYHHLDLARDAARGRGVGGRLRGKVGEGRDDYGTEFGHISVAIHAVAVAVDLGDAGHALDLARDVHYHVLSPERQARHMIDLAAAHAMRRQIGEAIHDLQKAEQLTPELTHAHHGARLVTRDLLQLSGLRPRPELRDLGERFGVLP